MVHLFNVFKKKLLVVFFEKEIRDEQTQLDFVSEKTGMSRFNSFLYFPKIVSNRFNPKIVFFWKNRGELARPDFKTVKKHRNGSIDAPKKPKIARKAC